jgi:hypothetical protein
MNYLLAFLGIIGVAIILAMSPLVIRLFEYLFPSAEGNGPPAEAANPHSIEHSELDEIRRLTAVLETGRRSAGR